MLALRFQVGGVSIFRALESAKTPALSVNGKLGNPALPFFAPTNAHEAGSARLPWASLVLHVVPLRHITQVLDSVIRWVSVHVVNVAGRPDAMNIKPCQPVRGVSLSANHDVPVTSPMNGAGNVANFHSWIGAFCNSEDARFRAVVQEFAQTLRSEFDHKSLINGSHPCGAGQGGDESPFRPLKLDQRGKLSPDWARHDYSA